MKLHFVFASIRHDTSLVPRAEMPKRSARRIAAAERAVRRELDSTPLFPELARFTTAEERLDATDRMAFDSLARIRRLEAECWRKLHRRLNELSAEQRRRFLEYWNMHTMTPALGCNACDALFDMFPRKEWYREDRKSDPGWDTPMGREMIDAAFEQHFGARWRAEFPNEAEQESGETET